VNGRVDLLFTDPNLVLDHLAEYPKQNAEIFFHEISYENQRHSYIAANKNTDKELLSRLRVAATKFQQTPHYRYLLAK
jgi:predicted transcriptional regulator YheO